MPTRKRPVNLNLFTIRFASHAIASILHRLSGVILFFFLPAMLWLLNRSLTSSASFDSIGDSLHSLPVKFLFWLCLSALVYHLFAGFRHLMMDADVGESLRAGKITAWLVISLSIMASVSIGVWLW